MLSTYVDPNTSLAQACEELRAADELIASALSVIGAHDVEADTGLPAEMLLSLIARRTGSEARFLIDAVATLRAMPFLESAFGRGDVSWSQVRAICVAVRVVDQAGRASVDTLIGSLAASLRDADPDELIRRIDDEVSRIRDDLTLHREDRQLRSNFLAIQGRLDGSASIYGEADAQSTASIVAALDAVAERPVNSDDPDAPSRASQHFDALLAICEASLNGNDGSTRPRPRLIATLDLNSSDPAQILWNLPGRAPRISHTATEQLLCDADIQTVIFRGARPVSVTTERTDITPAMRTALIARDGGCRFPGCSAPAAWTDAHHVSPQNQHGPTLIDNLVLLCRRCHRRIHRSRWRIELKEDATIEVTRRGQRFISHPRNRPPPRE